MAGERNRRDRQRRGRDEGGGRRWNRQDPLIAQRRRAGQGVRTLSQGKGRSNRVHAIAGKGDGLHYSLDRRTHGGCAVNRHPNLAARGRALEGDDACALDGIQNVVARHRHKTQAHTGDAVVGCGRGLTRVARHISGLGGDGVVACRQREVGREGPGTADGGRLRSAQQGIPGKNRDQAARFSGA